MRHLALALLAALALLSGPAKAEYPDRPIKLLVPYAAGGGADTAARILGQELSERLGQQVIVENRTGAGGVIAADAVAKAAPDGYTLLFGATEFPVNAALRKLPYDARRDLVPVSLVVVLPNILVVGPEAPYRTLAEFLDHARKNPGKLSYASAGSGSASHLAGEALNEAGGIDLVHVPYRGGAPALNDLMGGRVSAYFANPSTVLGHIRAGSVRALGIGSPERSPLVPDLPTLSESGLPGFAVQDWNALWAPGGTPPAIVERLGREIATALAKPENRAKFERLTIQPVGSTPAEFTRFLDAEFARTAAIVKSRGIKVD